MAINPALLANIFIPLIQQALSRKGELGIPTQYMQNYIVNDNLDPFLMLDSARSDDNLQGYVDDFLGKNKEAPSNYMADISGMVGGTLLPKKVLRASDSELDKLYQDAQQNPYGNQPATAFQSAISMLRENPSIGTPYDPDMIIREDLLSGIPTDEDYVRAPRDLYEDAAYSASDFESDDDPMDEKAKLFRKLVKGY